MLTSYRQKYNPKKPKTKLGCAISLCKFFVKKIIIKKSPSPYVYGEGRHQNTLHFKPLS